MNSCVVKHSAAEQSDVLNRMLNKFYSVYTIYDILEILPNDISCNGHRGYLSIGPLGIEWTSVNSNWKLNVVKSFLYAPNKNIFDLFIEALTWLDTEKDKITINYQN